ncbi:MAG: hypothetical protein QJT81_12430 [Candidatus Thiothrix putei]|uniref:Uncharacterized protein n=1 Tax=Candidatus Thiothrix putei TaxID=3080811 RepID=A0AA95KK70_9GAMM|nr:MAG: hypothetical protein QJT81_12430 [Candidatus Thiothrix putei]
MKKEPQKDRYSGELKEIPEVEKRRLIEEIQRKQRLRKSQEKKWQWLHDS